MDILLETMLGGRSAHDLNRIAISSGVPRATIDSWIRQDRRPRLDLVRKIAEATGHEIMLKRKDGFRLVTHENRINVMRENNVVAYVENDVLFAIDSNGYAEEIGVINHRVEIIGKLKIWKGLKK